ncbi:recombinase family protein [Deinococcus cellulosilyticus]|uniref:Recombinase family protein n=1 Tax=Deinococcus cellulosilyticus (strain DSM 18568 / NBRC 106333 / KACC 11606 / 5516J-15) TaxID=1223518 RepID=A0A511MYW0_DEIC1|nr:recombinase family protein [Deinococcus cellulosilyticus]GEM45337.1 hypothetical protein DC3_09720 [Deinococcus cellulosilyticus NBRC 106333 = KACC 11606]
MRAAIYLRVSTEIQTTRYGLDAQKADCEAYIKQQGYQLVATFSDAITGTSMQRPGLQSLLSRQDEFDLVVIPDVDRLARAVPAAYALRDQLLAAGLEVHGARDGRYDPDDESKELAFGFKAILASNERKRIVRRLISGRAAKVARGEFAKPIDAYGWSAGKINPVEAEHVRWIYSMALRMGGRQIIDRLELAGVLSPEGESRWHVSSLNRLLRNPLYRGEYHFKIPGGTQHVLPCDAIVKPEIWWAVQAAVKTRKSNGNARGNRTDRFPLTGNIKCDVCQHAMTGLEDARVRKDGTRLLYYTCGHSKHTRKRECGHSTHYPAADIHETVWTMLRALVERPEHVISTHIRIQTPEFPEPDLEAAKAELKRRWDRAYAAYEKGIISLDDLEAKKRDLDQAREALQARTTPKLTLDVVDWAARLRALLQSDTSLTNIVKEQGIFVMVNTSGKVFLEVRQLDKMPVE